MTSIAPNDFFRQLRSAAATMARRPEAVARSDARRLADLGLIGEYLDGLPYRSRIMELTEDDWLSWSFGQQRQFLDDLDAKVTLYQQIYDNTDLWIALDGNLHRRRRAVFPIPLDALHRDGQRPGLCAARRSLVQRVSGQAVFELHVGGLTIPRGDIVFLIGPSGCGKSTLLDLLAGTLAPSRAGSFTLCGDRPPAADLAALWRGRRLDTLAELRARHIGYVLQTGGLLPYLSVTPRTSRSRPGVAGRVDARHLASWRTGLIFAGCSTCRPAGCRSANASASPSPGPWPIARPWSWRTNRRRRSTRRRPTGSSPCCSRPRHSWGSPRSSRPMTGRARRPADGPSSGTRSNGMATPCAPRSGHEADCPRRRPCGPGLRP